jgi:hypothetical protein
MIVPEYILRDIVNQMPQISYQGQNSIDLVRTIQFGWGDKKELNKYLLLRRNDSYPLVWLLSPSVEAHVDNSSKVERDCSIVVATLETRKDLYNPQRYEGTFNNILNPVTSYVIQGLRSFSKTRILNDNDVNITKFPNYSEDSNSNQGGSIELWDATRIDCRIEFNNSCSNNIKWITN